MYDFLRTTLFDSIFFPNFVFKSTQQKEIEHFTIALVFQSVIRDSRFILLPNFTPIIGY